MHLEHTGADGAPLAAIERIERVIVHERASGTIIEGAAARGAQGRDESRKGRRARRGEATSCSSARKIKNRSVAPARPVVGSVSQIDRAGPCATPRANVPSANGASQL